MYQHDISSIPVARYDVPTVREQGNNIKKRNGWLVNNGYYQIQSTFGYACYVKSKGLGTLC